MANDNLSLPFIGKYLRDRYADSEPSSKQAMIDAQLSQAARQDREKVAGVTDYLFGSGPKSFSGEWHGGVDKAERLGFGKTMKGLGKAFNKFVGLSPETSSTTPAAAVPAPVAAKPAAVKPAVTPPATSTKPKATAASTAAAKPVALKPRPVAPKPRPVAPKPRKGPGVGSESLYK